VGFSKPKGKDGYIGVLIGGHLPFFPHFIFCKFFLHSRGPLKFFTGGIWALGGRNLGFWASFPYLGKGPRGLKRGGAIQMLFTKGGEFFQKEFPFLGGFLTGAFGCR